MNKEYGQVIKEDIAKRIIREGWGKKGNKDRKKVYGRENEERGGEINEQVWGLKEEKKDGNRDRRKRKDWKDRKKSLS